jgi:predicted DNA-binding antitoxin AbrB/MazE fold protein
LLQEFDAVFENGVLRPLQPLALPELEQVKVLVSRASDREWLDTEFMEACANAAGVAVSIEEVRSSLAKIQGSMDEAISADRGEF